MPDATLAEENPEIDSATGAEGVSDPVDAGPRCEKCGAPTDAAACPRCGWYPSLGIYVEVDEAYEAAMLSAPAEGQEEAASAQAASEPELLKHLKVWQGLIPGWGWLLIATALGIVGLAIGVRIATIASPTLQTYCGVGGLLLGLGVAVLAHFVGFVLCSFEDADFGVTDVIIKPLKVWKQIAGELPERLWLADTGVAGVTLALSAALIVGGIPYDTLLDWGIKARAKPNLVGAIAKQAAQGGSGETDLEGAVADFAGNADGVQQGAAVAASPKPVEKPRESLDCLIIGYQADKNGRIRALLLAADVSGRLKYIGKVTPEIESREEEQLVEKFQSTGSSRPFVKTAESGAWVRPKFTCRVTYADWPQGRRPTDLRWESLLDELSW